MSDVAEMYGDLREIRRERNKTQKVTNEKRVLALAEQGYKVRKITDYQYRINEVLDIFVVNMRFHNIVTNRRGGCHAKFDIIVPQQMRDAEGKTAR
jgi:hypothetical protein